MRHAAVTYRVTAERALREPAAPTRVIHHMPHTARCTTEPDPSHDPPYKGSLRNPQHATRRTRARCATRSTRPVARSGSNALARRAKHLLSFALDLRLFDMLEYIWIALFTDLGRFTMFGEFCIIGRLTWFVDFIK